MNANTNPRLFLSRPQDFYVPPGRQFHHPLVFLRNSPLKRYQSPSYLPQFRPATQPFISDLSKVASNSTAKNISCYRSPINNFVSRDLQPKPATAPAYNFPFQHVAQPKQVKPQIPLPAAKPVQQLPQRANALPWAPIYLHPVGPPSQLTYPSTAPSLEQPSHLSGGIAAEYHGISSEGLHPMVNLTSTQYFNAPATSGVGSDHSGGGKESVVITRYKFGDETPGTPISIIKPELTPVALYARGQPFTNEFQVDLVTSSENISEAIRRIKEANQRQSPGRSYMISESYEDGSRYEGEKVGNLKQGRGKFYYSNGEMYDGDWDKDRREGHGTLWGANGSKRYEGEWKGDLFHGKGVFSNDRAETLPKDFNFIAALPLERFAVSMEGDFFEGRFTGRGTVVLSDKSRYWGQFRDGQLNGIASLQMRDGPIVVGEWTANRLTKQF
eukprot:TRINITY_DN2499_c0_g2_i1.p1 TRINITY_DN2499_c0_g2~~TRINITY_DN2499_c0_g2_i1.p1  ORF type:complete len:442 (-),score=69.86 TRINITY_DN2499_c0_g2_i1:95-1420(-)